ncbi:MAG: D-glycero-beta-D-manno-heptose-7-phosphate kinase [Chloroflexota bacterium]
MESGLSLTTSALFERFEHRHVLVLGDMVADEYLVGRPTRISREAPVLILNHSHTFVRPGGATNTAYNFRRLGATTQVVGIVGDDEMGRLLRSTLDDARISTRGLIVDNERQTSTKTRILAQGVQEAQQQIVRVDRVDATDVPAEVRCAMIDAVRNSLDTVDTLLISDYDHGVISQEVIDACLPLAAKKKLTVVIDAHGDLFRFKGVTAATPNQPEAAAATHLTIQSETDLHRVGNELLHGMQAEGILVTRGSEGIALYQRDQAPYLLPVSTVHESQVVDPTGAGDTVAAVFTLALASGAPMKLCAYLGNIAGGEVVRRRGPATLTRTELQEALLRTRLTPP